MTVDLLLYHLSSTDHLRRVFFFLSLLVKGTQLENSVKAVDFEAITCFFIEYGTVFSSRELRRNVGQVAVTRYRTCIFSHHLMSLYGPNIAQSYAS